MMMPDDRLIYVRVMKPKVLSPCFYRLETISPCQAVKPIRRRPGSISQRM